MQTTPEKINPQVAHLINHIGLNPETAIWLKLYWITKFIPEPGNCLMNCMVQQKLCGGDIVFGWVIWQDVSIDFVEAEFHCVWRDLAGTLRDITPRIDGENQICFVPDPDREAKFDMSQHPYVTHTFENVRIYGERVGITGKRLDIPFTESALLNYLTD